MWLCRANNSLNAPQSHELAGSKAAARPGQTRRQGEGFTLQGEVAEMAPLGAARSQTRRRAWGKAHGGRTEANGEAETSRPATGGAGLRKDGRLEASWQPREGGRALAGLLTRCAAPLQDTESLTGPTACHETRPRAGGHCL